MATNTVTLQCIADSHVRQGTYYVVHNADYTAAGKHSDYNTFGFFAFEAFTLPPNATIVQAKFGGTVYGRLIAADRNFIIRPCVRAWTEAELHYDTETWPLSYSTPADTAVIGDTGSSFLADITNIAKAWFGGGYTYAHGLALYGEVANGYKQIYSRTAADTAKRPYIQITYSVPESVPTLSASTLAIATGSALTITTNRQNSAYTHNISWKVGAATGTISTAATTSTTWTLSAANATAILAQLPSATSGTCTITCATYDGTTLIGTRTVTLTVTVPASVVPTITGIALTGINQLGGHDVQGISSVTVAYTVAAGSGASVVSKSAVINGTTYTASPFTHKLNTAGSAPIVFTVTDTRGRTATVTNNTITVYAYAAPKISLYQVWRATAAGTATVDGTYLRFSLSASCSVVNGANALTVTIATRPSTSATWTTRLSTTTTTYTNTQLDGAPYDALAAYYVRLTLTDTVGTTSATEFFIPTQAVLINFDPDNKSVKFGGVRTDDEIQGLICSMNAQFNSPVKVTNNVTVERATGTRITMRNTTPDEQVSAYVEASTTDKFVQIGATADGYDESGFQIRPKFATHRRFLVFTPSEQHDIKHGGNTRRGWLNVSIPTLAAGATATIAVLYGYTFGAAPLATVTHLSSGSTLGYNIGVVGGLGTTTGFTMSVKNMTTASISAQTIGIVWTAANY